MPVIRYFQTAAFSVGFDLDAIEHERLSRFKRFNIESANAKGPRSTSFIPHQQLAKQASVEAHMTLENLLMYVYI